MFHKNYKKALRSELLERINLSDYDIVANSDDEKIIKLFEIFDIEQGYFVSKIGIQAALAGWLSGLPIVIDLPIYHDETIRFAEKIGSVSNPTESEENKIIDIFYNFIAANLLQMHAAARRLKRAKEMHK